MGTLEGHGGRFYEVWEVYGEPRGSKGVIYVRFGKCMGTLGVIRGRLFEAREVYGHPRGS